MRAPPRPPHPELKRTPEESFGWLPTRLLHQRWLARLGPEGAAVLVLLALAADLNGASYFGRDRMAQTLGLARHQIDRALEQLLELRLVAFRPWQPGRADGVWQLLPLPSADEKARERRVMPVSEVLASLGFGPEEGPRR